MPVSVAEGVEEPENEADPVEEEDCVRVAGLTTDDTLMSEEGTAVAALENKVF